MVMRTFMPFGQCGSFYYHSYIATELQERVRMRLAIETHHEISLSPLNKWNSGMSSLHYGHLEAKSKLLQSTDSTHLTVSKATRDVATSRAHNSMTSQVPSV